MQTKNGQQGPPPPKSGGGLAGKNSTSRAVNAAPGFNIETKNKSYTGNN